MSVFATYQRARKILCGEYIRVHCCCASHHLFMFLQHQGLYRPWWLLLVLFPVLSGFVVSKQEPQTSARVDLWFSPNWSSWGIADIFVASTTYLPSYQIRFEYSTSRKASALVRTLRRFWAVYIVCLDDFELQRRCFIVHPCFHHQYIARHCYL